MKEILRYFALTTAAVFFLALLWVGGGFLGLWWYQYAIQRQTAIVRHSNSYVTTKQQEMITLLLGYHQAQTDAQRRVIVAQLCQDATLIPGHVPASVSSVIGGECAP